MQECSSPSTSYDICCDKQQTCKLSAGAICRCALIKTQQMHHSTNCSFTAPSPPLLSPPLPSPPLPSPLFPSPPSLAVKTCVVRTVRPSRTTRRCASTPQTAPPPVDVTVSTARAPPPPPGLTGRCAMASPAPASQGCAVVPNVQPRDWLTVCVLRAATCATCAVCTMVPASLRSSWQT